MNDIVLLIAEGRVEDLQSKYPGVDVAALAQADPSRTNKYLQWMVKQADLGSRFEDLAPTVEFFHANQNRFAKRDISAYGTLSDLEDAVKNIGEKSKTKQRQEVKSQGASLMLQSESAALYRIDSRESCMLYGSNTRWCITMKSASFWEQYTMSNVIFYFILTDTEKFALAYQRDVNNVIKSLEIFDKKDRQIKISELTERLVDDEFVKNALNIARADASTRPKSFIAKLKAGEVNAKEFDENWSKGLRDTIVSAEETEGYNNTTSMLLSLAPLESLKKLLDDPHKSIASFARDKLRDVDKAREDALEGDFSGLRHLQGIEREQFIPQIINDPRLWESDQFGEVYRNLSPEKQKEIRDTWIENPIGGKHTIGLLNMLVDEIRSARHGNEISDQEATDRIMRLVKAYIATNNSLVGLGKYWTGTLQSKFVLDYAIENDIILSPRQISDWRTDRTGHKYMGQGDTYLRKILAYADRVLDVEGQAGVLVDMMHELDGAAGEKGQIDDLIKVIMFHPAMSHGRNENDYPSGIFRMASKTMLQDLMQNFDTLDAVNKRDVRSAALHTRLIDDIVAFDDDDTSVLAATIRAKKKGDYRDVLLRISSHPDHIISTVAQHMMKE